MNRIDWVNKLNLEGHIKDQETYQKLVASTLALDGAGGVVGLATQNGLSPDGLKSIQAGELETLKREGKLDDAAYGKMYSLLVDDQIPTALTILPIQRSRADYITELYQLGKIKDEQVYRRWLEMAKYLDGGSSFVNTGPISSQLAADGEFIDKGAYSQMYSIFILDKWPLQGMEDTITPPDVDLQSPIESLIPFPPDQGPPLPKVLGLKWPSFITNLIKKQVGGPEGEVPIALSIAGLNRTLNSLGTVNEGQLYNLKATVVNNSTRGGVPWAATLRVIMQCTSDTAKVLLPLTSKTLDFAAGETKVVEALMNVPFDAGVSAEAKAIVTLPVAPGTELGRAVDKMSITSVPVVYGATVTAG